MLHWNTLYWNTLASHSCTILSLDLHIVTHIFRIDYSFFRKQWRPQKLLFIDW